MLFYINTEGKMIFIVFVFCSVPSSENLLIQLYYSVPSIIDVIPVDILKPQSILSIPSKVYHYTCGMFMVNGYIYK